MALRPASVMARERILSYGGAGLGKSYDFYTIARLAKKTRSDAVFYVVDTDVSAWRMISDPVFADLLDDDGTPSNIVIYEVSGWDDLIGAMEEINRHMRPQDWLMVDMVTPTWDWVQTAFTEKVFGKDLDQFFLEARKAAKANNSDGGAFEGWKDWPVINSMYTRFTTMLLKCKGNLYCTAEQKKINLQQAEADTKAMFGMHGHIPAGQKRTPHLFQTVLWKIATVRPGFQQWEITTVKDRGRARLAGTPVDDFAKDYLVKVAGWKPL